MLSEPLALKATVMCQLTAETVPGGGQERPLLSSVGMPSVSRMTYRSGLQPLDEAGLPLKSVSAWMSSPGSADCPPAALISVVPGLLVSGWRNEVNFARAAVSE